MVSTIGRIRDRIQRLPSKSISYELVPYITEVHSVVGIILDYFRWLGKPYAIYIYNIILTV